VKRVWGAALAATLALTPAPAGASVADCEQAKAELAETTDPATVICAPAALRSRWGFQSTVGGWYETGRDEIVVITDYTYLIYRAIILHEHGHWYDWHQNPTHGFTSDERGVDREQYAKVYAWLAQGRHTPPTTQAPSPVPDDATIAAWQADGFMPTFVDPQIRRLYLAAFLRPPERVGLDYWTAQRAQGRDLFSIADHFAHSDEFVARYGPLTNRGYVDRIYRNVLGRAPDPEGHNWWTRQLDSGRTRGWLLVGFSESAEYREQTYTTSPGRQIIEHRTEGTQP